MGMTNTQRAKESSMINGKALSVCLVCDFFYPGLGGVEMHIYQLSQCLISLGCKVIVVTHFRGDRRGVRYMSGGLKVYYIPMVPFHDNCTLPALYTALPILRQIFIREEVDIVHGHQGTSNLAMEAMLHGRTMGYKVVFTDHSLFGFADAACIHVNKLLKFFLCNVDSVICVSYTNKLNLCVRASLWSNDVYVIPNAVDSLYFKRKDGGDGDTNGRGRTDSRTTTEAFGVASEVVSDECHCVDTYDSEIGRERSDANGGGRADAIGSSLVKSIVSEKSKGEMTRGIEEGEKESKKKVVIVVLSRLAYRKGIDLLVDAIPVLCSKHSNVRFVIGGDGPKRLSLEEMREKHRLHDRVTMLGSVSRQDVPSVLQCGDIYLNTSLTEAFCIANVEAAASGLVVVSTAVGGVIEVLPHYMMRLTQPSVNDICRVMNNTIESIDVLKREAEGFNEEIALMYNWMDVARRTMDVYKRVMKKRKTSALERFLKLFTYGTFAGILFVLAASFDHLFLWLLEWMYPKDEIDIAPCVCGAVRRYNDLRHPTPKQEDTYVRPERPERARDTMKERR